MGNKDDITTPGNPLVAHMFLESMFEAEIQPTKKGKQKQDHAFESFKAKVALAEGDDNPALINHPEVEKAVRQNFDAMVKTGNECNKRAADALERARHDLAKHDGHGHGPGQHGKK